MSRERQQATCVLCGGPPTEMVGTGKDFEYGTVEGDFAFGICRPCHHGFLVNPPSHDQLDAMYPPTYYTVNPDSPLHLKGYTYRKKLKMELQRVLKAIKGRAFTDMLEVGCGDCGRLLYFREHFPKEISMTGVDIQVNDEVAEKVRAKGIQLVIDNAEDLSTLRGEKKTYDLILMTQLFEHLFDPESNLKALHALLRPGGFLIIDTPNWDCLDWRVFKKHYWGTYQFPRHINLFSPRSLATLAKRVGFQVVDQGYLLSPGSWIASIRNRLGLMSSHYSKSPFEFFNWHCLPVVAPFALFDKLRVMLGGTTSNHYIVLTK